MKVACAQFVVQGKGLYLLAVLFGEKQVEALAYVDVCPYSCCKSVISVGVFAWLFYPELSVHYGVEEQSALEGLEYNMLVNVNGVWREALLEGCRCFGAA